MPECPPFVDLSYGHPGTSNPNLVYANEQRDWRIFSDVAAVLMRRAQRWFTEIPSPLGLEADLFALDATVIELSMALSKWV